MWRAGGETPTWPTGKRYALHHGLVAGNLAYAAWRDGGLTVLDVADPTQPRLFAIATPTRRSAAARIRPCRCPTATCSSSPTNRPRPTASRAALHLDVRHPRARQSGQHRHLSPAREADYCAKGGSFGPHNLHENRPGAFQSSRLIFATYYNAGVRAYDIENPFRPREVGYLRAIQSGAHDGPAPEPAAGDPVLRLLCRSQRSHVPDRSRCRPFNILQFEGDLV